MKQAAIVAVAILTLGTCAGEGKILNRNPSAVIIRHDGSHAASTRLAAQHCAQYNKDIRLVQT
jgi:hypothetical protein